MEFLDIAAFAIFTGTILERFYELLVSRRHSQWSLAQGGVEFGASHYKWMVVLHVGFLISILLEFFVYGNELVNAVRMLAMLAAVLAQGARWWVISTLGQQWNTRVIIVPGLQRVSHGPFRYVNHPNYVVVVFEVLMLPLIFGAWKTSIVFSLLNALLLRERIRIENVALQQLKP